MNVRKVKQVAAACARLVMKELRREFAKDGKATKKALVSFLRRELPPSGGRPRNRELDRAQKLRAQGCGFEEIAAKLRPGFYKLAKSEQRLLKDSLMRGLQRRRATKRSAGKGRPINTPEDKGSTSGEEGQANIGHEAQDA